MKCLKTLALIVVLTIGYTKSFCQKDNENNWSFVFMTDIHITYENNAVNGFSKALKLACDQEPAFILTGGDLIADALEQPFNKADMFYKLYDSITTRIEIPIHNTMGNHEIFGWLNESTDSTHKEYGKKMFQNRIGKSYYSFMHNGWRFIILDSVEELEKEMGYYGNIGSEQIEWLKTELAKTDKNTPIIISTHIPFFTLWTQLTQGSTFPNPANDVILNSKEIFELFNGYNLKLILQGHLHIFEDLYIYNTRFITGGAVSAAWWNGPNEGTEEGFVKIDISNKELLSIKYIDYNWDAESNKK